MKTRSWKKLGIILSILAVFLILIVMIIPKLIDLNQYNGLIVSEVQKAVGGKVKLGRISWGISHSIWLKVDGFSITGASAFPGDVKLTHIYANVSIHPLLARKVVLKKLLLESSEVRMRLEPGTAESQSSAKDPAATSQEKEAKTGGQDQPIAPPSTGAGAKPVGVHLPVEIEIEQLSIKIDRLEIDDAMTLPGQTLVHVFTGVDLTASNITPGEELAFKAALGDKNTSGLAGLKAQGTFSGLTESLTIENPNLKLKAELSALHTDAIKPYLKNSQLEKQLAGSVSLEIDYEGDLSKNHRTKGVIDLSRITYTDSSLWDAALPGQETTITYQAKLDPHDLIVEKLTLKLGSLSLDARADVHSWSKDPVIKKAEFSSDLSLRDLIAVIPWKQLGENAAIIRPILEGGGKIILKKVVLPEISLTKLPANLKALLPEIEMTAQIVGVSMQLSTKIPKLENITGAVHLANGIARVAKLQARMASVALPPISAQITNLLAKPKIDARIKGPLKMDAISDEKLATLIREIGMEKLVGAADVDLTVELDTARPEDFQLQGNLGLRDIQIKTVYTPALIQGLRADIDIKPDVANISHLSAVVVLPAAATSAGGNFKLELQGRVDQWRRTPAVTLQNFKTSSISLPLLASTVPWKKFGASAKPAKEILLAGGTVTIEDFALPKIDLSKPLKDPAHLLPKVRLAASFDDVTVPPIQTLLPIEGITGRVNLENDVLTADNVHAKLGPFSLPTVNIRATNIAGHPRVALRAKGPLQVAATGDAQVKKLLMKHGLKSLTVSADIDMSADFDQRKPKNWTANGSLVFKDVRAETHPAAVVLDNLQGEVTFSRKKTVDVSAQDITARINQAPVHLSGKFLGIGTPTMLVAAKVYAKQLDLAHLAELFPTLKDLKLGGTLDMNLDVHVPYATPTESRLKGTVTTHNASFRLAASGLAVEKANTEIELDGNTANIKTMTMLVNDQKLALSGQISNPVEPKAQLLVTSPDLNLDRLLLQDKAAQPSSKPSKEKGDQTKESPVPREKTAKTELPPLARKLTADLQVKATQGRYKGLQFQKLKLNLLYKRGVIESYDLNFAIDEGHIDTEGSADLQDPDRITFVVNPDIDALQLEKVAPFLGVDKLPLNGPMSLKGQLRGRTGSREELLGSLDGHLNAEIGPGHLNKTGKAGDLFAKIFSMAHIRTIFSGRMLKDLAGEGIPFQIIKAQTTFAKGTLNLNNLNFASDAMDVEGQGTIDLLNQKLNIKALLEPLATVDKALKFIPIVGKETADMTKIRIDVEGPLEDPKIHTAETKEIGSAILDEAKEPGTIMEDLGKRLKKIF